MIRMLGDIYSQAQGIASSIGSSINCKSVRTYLPFTDPNTGLNYYDQNLCTGASDGNLHDAGLIVKDPWVYAAELAHPYAPMPATPQQIAAASAHPTEPVIVTHAVPPPAPAIVPPEVQPILTYTPATPAPPPGGWNIWNDPNSPFHINTSPTQAPGAANPNTGQTITVTTTEATPQGFTDQGFWQQPVKTIATSMPWWVWVGLAFGTYQFLGSKR